MADDTIIAELRRLRDAFAERFDYDARAMLEDLRKRQATGGRRVVSFPPLPVSQPSVELPGPKSMMMVEEPDSAAFCRKLRELGAGLFDGVDPRLLPFLTLEIQETDLCHSESVTIGLESEWCFGPERAVNVAIDSWLDVVRDRLDGLFGPDSTFPWKQTDVGGEEQADIYLAIDAIQLRRDPDLIAKLIAVAS